MGKKRYRRGRRRIRIPAKQIRYLTQGMGNINFADIARKSGVGKDTDQIRRAVRKSQKS